MAELIARYLRMNTPGNTSALRRDSALIPTRAVQLAPRAAHATAQRDGSILLFSTIALESYPESWNLKLLEWAAQAPDRIFLTEANGAGGRSRITFAETLGAVRQIAEALLNFGLNQEHPLAILSENSINCALITLACLWAGIPASPISPAYALMATEYSKLSGVITSLQPGALYVADGQRYGTAVAGATAANMPVISAAAIIPGRQTTMLATLRATTAGPRAAAANAAVNGATIAKILFTSGSSGAPKPVAQTHRMLAANRQQNAQGFAFLLNEPPVMVDWLPWHHTFGGNNNFGFALWCGGTLHIDDGVPTAGGVARTIALLKAHPPTFYLNTPGGFAAILPYLAEDPNFAARFFSRLKLMQYGGAVLPPHIWEALDDIAVATTGTRIQMVSGVGSTECGPTPVVSTWEQHRKPEAGLPLPGVEAKLVPTLGTWELRVRGVCVMPEYWRLPKLTAAAFDQDGFFMTGDAVKPLDPEDFAQGLVFDGRISDNFKLASGTWVQAMKLRTQLLSALAPLLKDAVLTGHNRMELGAIGFPNMATAREIAGATASADDSSVLASPALRDWVSARLNQMAAGARGSSERIVRLCLEAEPPSFNNGELTDKGTAAARIVLARRGTSVDALHEVAPGPNIYVVS